MALSGLNFSLPLRTEYGKTGFLNYNQLEQVFKLPKIGNNSHTNRQYIPNFQKNKKQKSFQNLLLEKSTITNNNFYRQKNANQRQNSECPREQFQNNPQIQKIKSLKNFSIHKLDIIGTYRIGRTIGKGSGSIVRSVKNWKGGVYAMKSYENYNQLDQYKKKNIQNQIKILQRVNHKSILKYIETITNATSVHIVTQYIQHKSLREWLKIHNQIDKNTVQYTKKLKIIFKQILEILDYLHSLDIAHRDIKLQNILISSKDLQVTLIDFGFALQNANELSVDFCGTPHYIAPQIITRRGFHSKSADIWATGVLFFKLATGSFPFKGSNDKILFKKISRGQLSYPEQFSADILKIISKMIVVDQSKRLSSSDLLRDLWFLQQE